MEKLKLLPYKSKIYKFQRNKFKFKILLTIFLILYSGFVFKLVSDFNNYKTTKINIEKSYVENNKKEINKGKVNTKYNVLENCKYFIKSFRNIRIINGDIKGKEINIDILVDNKEEYLQVVTMLERDKKYRITKLSALIPQNQFFKFNIVIEVMS